MGATNDIQPEKRAMDIICIYWYPDVQQQWYIAHCAFGRAGWDGWYLEHKSYADCLVNQSPDP